jgi:hypothetical protein
VPFKNVMVLISVLAIGLISGACSSSSPSGPTQLSGAATSSSTTITNGATINGSITGAALSAISDGGSGFATANGPGLIVTVVGTTITAQANPNGTFVLTNVPPGDIQLRFTGPGTDALLTVTGVTGGEELRITVQVNGNKAMLKDVSRQDTVDKVELEGLVTAGTCGLFTVRNVVVTTNATTVFKNGRCEEIALGARVHVRATPTGVGTALAMLVNIQRDADDNGKSGDHDDDEDDDSNRSGGNSGNGGGNGKGKK